MAAALKVERLIAAANKATDDAQAKALAATKKTLDGLVVDYQALERKITSFSNSQGKSTDRVKAFRTEIEKLAQKFEEFGALTPGVVRKLADMERSLGGFSAKARSASADLGLMGEKVAKVFGKGSRNNFINVVGGAFGLVASIPSLLAKGVGQAADVFSALRKAADDVFDAMREGFTEAESLAGGFFQAFSKGASQALQSMAELAAEAPEVIGGIAAAVLVALPALTVFVGVVVSALSSMVAIIVALAGSISFALIGAVAALAPADRAVGGGGRCPGAGLHRAGQEGQGGSGHRDQAR